MPRVEVVTLLRESAREWVEDKAPKQAAALSYYALFALGPLFLLVVSLAGLLFGAEAARGSVRGWLAGVLGAPTADAVAETLAGARSPGRGLLGALLGFAVLLFAAGGLFGHLKETLNTVWEIEHKPRGKGFKAKVIDAMKENAGALLAVFGVGLLVIVSLVASTLIAAAATIVGDALPGGAIVWFALNVLASLAVLSAAFALLFKAVPDAKIAWRDVWIGGAITAVLFTVGQLAIGLYVGAGGLSTKYGAAGALVAVLVWVYYSAMILFFGAEITQIYANKYGSQVRPEADAQTVHEDIVERHAAPSQEGTRADPKARSKRGRRA